MRVILRARYDAIEDQLDEEGPAAPPARGTPRVGPEGAFYGLQVGLVAVRRKLHPVCQAARYVVHEHAGIARVPAADVPGNDELGVRVDRGPGPDVPDAFRRGLGVAQRPNLIALDPLTFTPRTVSSWKASQA